MVHEIDLSDIESWEYVDVPEVYDLSVEGNHNYFIDVGRPVLVHNSSKTWSGVDIIIWLCTSVEKHCKINIYRETFAEFSDTLYDDFKRRLDDYDIPNPFHNAQIVRSFKIGQNTVSFKGCDRLGSNHGAGADYVFFNEMMHIPQGVFDQAEMRCRKFWWGDYNPSFTDHWVFRSVITRPDVGFLRTTFQDNPHISDQERNKILSYEPWQPGSYEVTPEGDLLYQGEPITESNQPPPHLDNIHRGTADEFMWKVYGLGLRGAMKGRIFKQIEWIDKWPEGLAHTYGMDFGFTNDPTAVCKYGREGRNIYIEPLIYQPIPTPDELDEAMKAVGMSKYVPISADSSDRYVSDTKGAFQMVTDLFDRGWEISKVSKTKSVMYWLQDMKGYKIHIVRNHLYQQAKNEVENYVFKEVNGILINQPVDRFNHLADSARYAHMSYDVDNMSADIL